MALRIQQGPLPLDFTRNDASTFLEDWVNNTKIFDIGPDNFAADFGLIVSQTEAPSSPARGQLWFKRGAGQLFFRDDPDRGDSRYTNSHWVMIAPSRELIVQLDFTAAQNEDGRKGAALSLAFDATEVGTLDRYYTDDEGRDTTFMTSNILNTDTTVASNFIFLAQDSQVSGYDVRALEWGFGEALMGSGASSVAGRYIKAPNNTPIGALGIANGEDWAFHCRQTDVSEIDQRLIGIATKTGGSAGLHLLKIFKRPTAMESWYD